MKRITNSRSARTARWMLRLAALAPVLLASARTAPVLAQSGVGTQTTTVILVPFENKSGVLGNLLARQASAAVANELAASGRYEVLPEDQVNRQAAELGMKPPFRDKVQLSRLGERLGASAVVTGEVAWVKAEARSQPKLMRVAMRVTVADSATGDLLNGAAQIGEARGVPGRADDESLAQDALDNAATLAVRQILGNTLPVGTIMSSVGSGSGLTVLINRGSRDGIEQGMELVVMRGRVRVGRIRATNVFPADSEASVIENVLGIRPEDTARAIFPMPALPKIGEAMETRDIGRVKKSSSASLGKLLTVLAVAVGVFAVVSGGGNATVTNVTAEAAIQNSAPAVVLNWRDNIFGQRPLEYHIWRSPGAVYNFQGTPVAATGPAVRTYTDFAAPFSFWDGIRGFQQPPLPQGGGNQGGGNGTSTTVTPAANEVLGFAVGQTTQYQINAVIRRPVPVANTGGGGGGGQTGQLEDIDTDVVVSGSVTPITQTPLNAPAEGAANQNIASLVLNWNSRRGADVFVVEISPDRTFSSPNLIHQTALLFSSAPNSDAVAQSVTLDIRNSTALRRYRPFLDFVTGASSTPPVLFWRVGARNSGDRPGPVHFFSKNNKDRNTNFRFIYSDARSFTPAQLPPPPP